MTKTYKPIQVANWFIQHGIKTDNPIDQMQMHKLLYFSHAYWIGAGHDNLFNEDIQAWRCGAVVADIYDIFAHYEKKPITTTSFDLEYSKELTFDKTTKAHLFGMWQALGGFSGVDLMKLSHRKGDPW